MSKFVYSFVDGQAEGGAQMRDVLGGKGANVQEMMNLGLPVPPGFTISTDVCQVYADTGAYPQGLDGDVEGALRRVERDVGQTFGECGDAGPLLVSVRSGAAVSMPGMMDTVLNLGLSDRVVAQWIAAKPGDAGHERFVWDSFRRFIAMYANIVRGLDMHPFEHELEETKKRLGIESDSRIPAAELRRVVDSYKRFYQQQTGEAFPQGYKEQLWGAIGAVFGSWNNPRALKYREMNNIRGLKGTAVTVQSMVFGNLNDDSATGVAFSRNPSTGDPSFYGEWLANAQGEDVVAGLRTGQQITKRASVEWAAANDVPEARRAQQYPSMEEAMPECYEHLLRLRQKLETHFRDMQDMEFTIMNRRLFFLQTRNGKRTGGAAARIAVDMVREGLITQDEALMRIDAGQMGQLLLPQIDTKRTTQKPVAKGLPASPGAAVGQIVFTAEDAERWAAEGKAVVMVRVETSPEDLVGMDAAKGILTKRGGMTSHAAVVARGMGKCCVAGCAELDISYDARTLTIHGRVFREGEWVSLNGSTGDVIDGKAALVQPDLAGGPLGTLLEWANARRRLGVRTNADTPKDAAVARRLGAEGVGLCRTEHMFFEGDRIDAVREMILAEDEAARRAALAKIVPYQRADFEGIFRAMEGLPVTVRLLDPPLHEFVPHSPAQQADLARKLGIPAAAVANRVAALHEENPMLGHRGVRLGLTYPEIYDAQILALFEAAARVRKAGVAICPPEIMVPLVGKVDELSIMRRRIDRIAAEVLGREGAGDLKYMVGTMIEVPRAAITAGTIAAEAEFFSFGTNDLTQMGCGFSRDDSAAFLKEYVRLGIYESDPFQVLDQAGVGELVRMAVAQGRAARPGLKCGICGEHGGEPTSVKFCHRTGLDYVSCSPYRVPTAILAAGQAAIEEERAAVLPPATPATASDASDSIGNSSPADSPARRWLRGGHSTSRSPLSPGALLFAASAVAAATGYVAGRRRN